MNEQFIRGVIFDWNKIESNSYLRKIEAFKGMERLDFNCPITFFVGENGSGKSTLLEALAVAHGFNPEGGTKNYVFSTRDTHSELCDAITVSKGYRKEKWGIFCGRKAFTMLRRRRKNMRIWRIPQPDTMKNRMEKASLRWRRISCGQTGYIFLMNRRRHCPRRDSLLC